MATSNEKRAAAKISGNPAADLTDREAEGILFAEIGTDTPHPDPGGVFALRAAKKSIEKNSRRAQDMGTENLEPIKKDLEGQPETAQEVQEHTKTAEKEQEAQERTPQQVRGMMEMLAFSVDYFKNPEDAMYFYEQIGDAPNLIRDIYDKQHEQRYLQFVDIIAKKTGADPEQIKDPKRRTEQQQKYLLELSAREQLARFDAFFNSNYWQATEALEPIEGKYKDPEPQDDYTIKQYATLLFFEKHYPDIKPTAAKSLTEDNIAEVIDLFYKLDAFYYEQTNGGEVERTKDFFTDFVNREAPQLPAIHYINSNEFRTVTDKLANVFFAFNAPIGGDYVNGQRTMIPLKYEGKKSKKEITLFYDYVFNEDIIKAFGLQKRFDDYDFFVMSTLDNLKYEGNEVVSLTKIWHEMGNTGTPGAKHLTELTNSLRKGLSTTITVDDKQVKEAWGQDVSKYHELISPAMPVQILTEKFTANGNTAAGMVKINSFSPFFLVAQPLGHFGAWNKDILRLYGGRRTKRYYAVMHYLIREIGWMLNDKSKRNNKLALQSLYSYAGDKTPRAKQLTKNIAYRLLDEVFIPTGYIKSYKEDAQDGGICLFWEGQKTIANKRKILPPPG